MVRSFRICNQQKRFAALEKFIVFKIHVVTAHAVVMWRCVSRTAPNDLVSCINRCTS